MIEVLNIVWANAYYDCLETLSRDQEFSMESNEELSLRSVKFANEMVQQLKKTLSMEADLHCKIIRNLSSYLLKCGECRFFREEEDDKCSFKVPNKNRNSDVCIEFVGKE